MRASVAAVLLAAAACRHGGDPRPPERPAPWLDPAAAPPDAPANRYLVDPSTGAVHLQLPPEILADVRLQLVRMGHEEEARALERLYDLETGRVRDAQHAKAAEAKLRGPDAPPIEPPAAPPGNPPPSPPAIPDSAGAAMPGTQGAAGGAR